MSTKLIKIGIDAGHETDTDGKRTAPFNKNVDIDGDGTVDVKKGQQYKEHYANVMVADKLVTALKRCKSFKITIAGFDNDAANDDPHVSLSERQTIFRSAGCEITVSIHFNASAGNGQTFDSASGVGVYIHDKYPEKSRELANVVLKHLLKGTDQKDRGVNSQALSLCNCRTMKSKASILCELAFMTNEREAQELMANEKFCTEAAEEIANALCEYTGVEYIGVPEETKVSFMYRIQAGAYKIFSSATSHCEKLKKAGIKEAKVRYGSGLYKIQIGDYDTKAKANNMLKKIQAAGFEAFITTN